MSVNSAYVRHLTVINGIHFTVLTQKDHRGVLSFKLHACSRTCAVRQKYTCTYAKPEHVHYTYTNSCMCTRSHTCSDFWVYSEIYDAVAVSSLSIFFFIYSVSEAPFEKL